MTPTLKELAEAALAILAREGEAGAADEGHREWRAQRQSADGTDFVLTCIGPDLPATVPDEILPPEAVSGDLHWLGRYRLRVTAPLVVLDLYWRPDEPLRIMTFSRGDWEGELLALAA